MPPLFSTSSNSLIDMAKYPLPSPYAVTISLADNSTLQRRVITLHPGAPVPIGRSSRSEVKNLSSADDNALFDCPVVSRRHAELQLSSWKPRHDQISITDLTSLHGTIVNGKRIEPGCNFSLKSGDLIKLGDQVTKGDDTHDGISLTFERLDEIHHTSPVGPSYQVPSPESAISDYDSDMESTHDDLESKQSSANTTPDKVKLGSQSQPIDLDPVTAAVIDLSQEEMEKDETRVVPDTYAEDNASIVAAEEDMFKEQSYPASDEEDRASERMSEELGFEDYRVDEDAEDDQVISSPEDNFATAPQQSLHSEGPTPQTSAFEGDFPAYKTNFMAPYDPVRGSHPPSQAANFDSTATLAPPKPRSTYTYGCSYGMIPPYLADPATDLANSSRWDLRPSDNYAYANSFPKYLPEPSTFTQSPPFAPSYSIASSGLATGSNAVPVNKLSIPDIIENGEADSVTPDTEHQIEAAAPSASRKRKADEDDAANEEADEASQPRAKRAKATTSHSNTVRVPRSRRHRTHRRGTVSAFYLGLAAAFGSAFGSAATVVFLSSPAAQWVIDYLA